MWSIIKPGLWIVLIASVCLAVGERSIFWILDVVFSQRFGAGFGAGFIVALALAEYAKYRDSADKGRRDEEQRKARTALGYKERRGYGERRIETRR